MDFLFRLANHYGTLWVTLLIWIGLFLYLMKVDRRIGELEREVGDPLAGAEERGSR
jgi:CcmD family protein